MKLANRTIQKILLTVIACLPLSAIRVAAQVKLMDLAGEEQNSRLFFELQQARNMLFPENTMTTTIDAAYERARNITGIMDHQILDQKVKRSIQILMDKGFIEMNETVLESKGPSWL